MSSLETSFVQTFEALSDSLRRMNDECKEEADYGGVPYPEALRWYAPTWARITGASHAKQQGANRTEHTWSLRLAQLLSASDLPCCAQVSFPDRTKHLGDGVRRGTCDLVVHRRPEQLLWIEIKGAWRFNYSWKVQGRELKAKRNAAFEKHLLGTHDSAFTDIRKLTPLCSMEAEAIGLLVVAFGSDAGELEHWRCKLIAKAGLDKPPWVAHLDGFADPHYDEQVCVWFWARNLTA